VTPTIEHPRRKETTVSEYHATDETPAFEESEETVPTAAPEFGESDSGPTDEDWNDD
jgi:hypothetical protein